MFDTTWYLWRYPDVRAAGMNPLLHYLLYGAAEGRDPHPGCDTSQFLDHNPDVRVRGNPLRRHLMIGHRRGRPNVPPQNSDRPTFSPAEPVVATVALDGRSRWYPGALSPKLGAPTVLVCAHWSGPELFGAERSFVDVLDGLRTMELNAVVTVPSGDNTRYVAGLGQRSLGVYVIPYVQWSKSAPFGEWAAKAFMEVMIKHRIKVLHANTIMLREPLEAARRLGITTVIHAREIIPLDDDLIQAIGEPILEIVRQVMDRADYIIANSQATARIFSRRGRIFVVPNAVDVKDLNIDNVVDPAEVRFAMISFNIPKKGITDFVELARLCHGRVPNARFLLIGPNNWHIADLKKDRAAGRIPRNLVFKGYCDSPRQAVAEANVVVNMSRFAESFGRTVAEGFAARRPAIAYEWGAIPELVEHGVNGFLVPYGDVAAAVRYVEQLCAAPERVAEMGQAGRAFVQRHHTIDVLVDRLRDAYARILEQEGVVFSREQVQPPRQDVGMKTAAIRASNLGLLGAARRATVVIPVFNGYREFKTCSDSVLRHTSTERADILFIDDASTDPRMNELLRELAAKPGVRCLVNSENQGYTRTINRGIRESGDNDVVLLNSDTIVTPRWLEALRITAYSEANVGTVTALGDNAGAFSVPIPGQPNAKPDVVSHDDYARMIVQACADCESPEVPTGNGFCMYIRRDLFYQIDLFDERGFPRGYGEENDFCMRAMRQGWRNLICPRAFVFHVRSVSFGSEKEQLMKRGLAVVTSRYPDYAAQVHAALSHERMERLRKCAAKGAEAAAKGHAPERRLLVAWPWPDGRGIQTVLEGLIAGHGRCRVFVLARDASRITIREMGNTASAHNDTLGSLTRFTGDDNHREMLTERLVTNAIDAVYFERGSEEEANLGKICALLNIPAMIIAAHGTKAEA